MGGRAFGKTRYEASTKRKVMRHGCCAVLAAVTVGLLQCCRSVQPLSTAHRPRPQCRGSPPAWWA
jgi:hypothetical protein